MRQLDHFIVGGASAPAARTHKIWNPSTGEVQAEVPLGDAALLDRAVAAMDNMGVAINQSRGDQATFKVTRWTVKIGCRDGVIRADPIDQAVLDGNRAALDQRRYL